MAGRSAAIREPVEASQPADRQCFRHRLATGWARPQAGRRLPCRRCPKPPPDRAPVNAPSPCILPPVGCRSWGGRRAPDCTPVIDPIGET
ncbi:hypothetical protein Acry_2292 [Acidiphilium cryptum JF-5]|uniref:Uncharacterized protein n=1 Tax=Acidiphilium cryptum (strain JF-5) TaxID=349163 RepID=A5G0V5_ACICJ|nr:hypothetical protein Acry_2292 [Acidiphilium cryptum JF-5]